MSDLIKGKNEHGLATGSSSPPRAIQVTSKDKSKLRYLPAGIISIFFLALFLFSSAATDWAKPLFYGLFLKIKGPPPTTESVGLISLELKNGTISRSEVVEVVNAILKWQPSVLAINLPSSLAVEPDEGELNLQKGNVVIAHGFHHFKPWVLTQAAVQPQSNLLARSTYPLLDVPGKSLDLPMGENLGSTDSSLHWPKSTTGFSWPINRKTPYEVQAFAQLSRGVVANLGIEAMRRHLEIPAKRIGYLENVGVLFNADFVLPVDNQGRMYLRFHTQEGLPRILPNDLLEGRVDPTEIKGKVIFLDAIDPHSTGFQTVMGSKSATEIWAEAAAGLADKVTLTSPAWGNAVAVLVGLVFAAIMAALMLLEFSNSLAFCLALGLMVLYPVVALIGCLTASLWMPPMLPPLLVAAFYFPGMAARLLFPVASLSSRPSASPQNNPKANAPKMAPESLPKSSAISPPVTPTRPRTQAPMERQSIPEPRFTDPRDPPILQNAKPPLPPSAPIASASHGSAIPPSPSLGNSSGKPSVPAPQKGSAGDDIERDAKGGLVRVGKYRIIRKMGFGSAGDVFEGLDLQMNRQVALKTITKNASNHFDRASERFELEAKAAGSLNHPNINTVYDFGTIRDVSYMVLEFLDGVTLSQWIRNNPVAPSPRHVSPWLQQICSAMDYAHSHKVIHRDLKPSNLMIVNGGATIKLLDFGIAKMEDVGLTQTGMTVGTPLYMSPEQLSGLKVGPSSDQYSLAVVIYQLLTYKVPYLGTKIPELCNRILKNEIVPITDYNPALSGAFWEALRKAFSKLPDDRYTNCLEMYQALEANFPD